MRAFTSISVLTALCLLSAQASAAPGRESAAVATDYPVIEITNETLAFNPQRVGSSKTVPETTRTDTLPTLTWTVPAQRTDGSPFYRRELGGYFLTIKNRLTGGISQVQIRDPDATSYVLRAYRAGRYSFAIQSYDLDGLISPYSQWVNVTI